MDGIHIPAEVAQAADVPVDLDSSRAGAYAFPSPRRRRTAALIYLALAVALWIVLPRWGWLFGMGMLTLAVWHWRAAWPLQVEPEAALRVAATAAPFPVGHASAAIIFSGFRSRPLWHVVMYDAANPPKSRALVVVDGVDGHQVGSVYTEDLPLD